MRDYLAARTAHLASTPPGPSAARRLSELTDEAVRGLSRTASARLGGSWALLALGGWGSGMLQPESDLDILVLSDASPDRLKPFVEELLYPLWDAGLDVGHQVRSPKQQLRAMREDVVTCTAALTARFLDGDPEWAEAAVEGWLRDVRKRARRVLAGLQARERSGSPYLLEPDLKDGAGGRRDYDELVWTASVLSGKTGHGAQPLVDEGVLAPEDLARLEAARDTITTARWALQLHGHGNRMGLDALDDLPPELPEAVNAALAETAFTLERVHQQIETVSRAAKTAETDGLTPAAVYELLRSGEAGLPALEEAAHDGCLDALVPGFRALMSCRRPGLGHTLTVGAHSLRTAALVAHPPVGDTALDRSHSGLEDERVAWVAALAHDAGKAEGGAGHAERGAPAALDAAVRFGLAADAAADVADLVRLHLLLVETALHGDLDDEDTILRCAALIGRRGLLAPLHLLTAADSRATGPSTWTPWSAALVGTLVARLDAALSPEIDGAGLVSEGERVRAAALAVLGGARPHERAFVEHASLRYLASRDAAIVARHARLAAELLASPATEALFEVSGGPVPGTHGITVATADRSHSLARLTGAIALAGLDVLSLDAYSAPDNIALDSFVVTSATKRPATPGTFVELERLARLALRDRLALETRLAERQRHYPRRAKGASSVSVEPGGWTTVLKVTAPDRPALLHDVARAIADTELDVRWARIQTIGGMARDVFHLAGADGGPVDDPGVLGHLVMRVRAVL